MFGMGHWEILIILLIGLLVFGAGRIPEMARGMGKGIREFRQALKGIQDDITLPPGSVHANSEPAPSTHLRAQDRRET